MTIWQSKAVDSGDNKLARPRWRRALQVECSLCKAKPGEYCTSTTYPFLNTPKVHQQRVMAAPKV